MNKTWKQLNIPHIISEYMISNFGDIVNIETNETIGRYHSTNGRDFVPMTIDIDNEHHTRLFDLDLLVCSTFNDIPDELKGKRLYVHHINGDLRDCFNDNLIWKESVEIWKTSTFPNILPDKYEVSSYGRLRHKYSERTYNINAVNSRGYITTCLKTIDGEDASFQRHRLIAWEFFPESRDISKEVNHINGVKTHNYYTNLEWVTHEENMLHAYSLNMITRNHGEILTVAKMNNETANRICELFIVHFGNANNVYRQMKEEGYDVTLKQIQHIKHKECWEWLSDRYWSTVDLYKLHIKKIVMICEELVKCNGNVNRVLQNLTDKIPYLSKRFIQLLKYKEAYSDISDKYFSRNSFK